MSQFQLASQQNNPAGSSTEEVPKLPDFLSRFGGGILYIKPINDDSRRFDKLCIAAQLLRRRFQEYGVYEVPIELLQFLCKVSVVHEVRSIESIINLLDVESIVNLSLTGDLAAEHENTAVNLDPVFLPLKKNGHSHGPLRFHITEDDHALETLWAQLSTRTVLVPIAEPSFDTYAQEYEALRRFMPQGGPERTFMLMALAAQVKALAQQILLAPSEINDLFNRGGEGNRMVALTLLQALPASACFANVLQAIDDSQSGFEQSAALRAAEQMLPHLTESQVVELARAIRDPSKGGRYIQADESRRRVGERILSAIAKRGR